MSEIFDAKTSEIEFKYKADNITLSKFLSWIQTKKAEKNLDVSGWDIYYSGKNQSFEFIRYRAHPGLELTIKIPQNNSNQNRFELNVPLSPKVNEWMITKFCNLFGFEEDFRIFKSCFIYWFEKVDVVYYIVFDKNMNEKARFIEIEARQDYPFTSLEEAKTAVEEIESELSCLGITPQNRMRNSLWNMFRS
jgi:adenylate cyclase class IV